MWGLECVVEGLGYEGLGYWFLGLRVLSLLFGVCCLSFGVWGLGFVVWGLCLLFGCWICDCGLEICYGSWLESTQSFDYKEEFSGFRV